MAPSIPQPLKPRVSVLPALGADESLLRLGRKARALLASDAVEEVG